MKDAYRWLLKIGTADYYVSDPIWNDGVSLLTERQTGEKYRRTSLDGRLTYRFADYEAINAAAFDTEFRVRLQKQRNNHTWATEWEGRFYKTDCDFDANVTGRFVTVTPTPVDLYEAVVNGMDKEFNIIDLEPPTVEVNYKKQAILQVVFPGAPFMANFTDGMFWETPVASPLTASNLSVENDNHNAMRNDYGFGIGTGYNNPADGLFNYSRSVIVGENLTIDVSGEYRNTSYAPDGFDSFLHKRLGDEAYQLTVTAVTGGFRMEIAESGGVKVYASATSPTNDLVLSPMHDGITLTSLTSSETVQVFIFRPYVRLLTDRATVQGTATVALPTDDPFNKGVFTRALPVDTLNFLFSDGHSTTPTRWGKHNEGTEYENEYFTRPTSPNGSVVMPVAASIWDGASAWFYFDDDLRATAEAASEDVVLKHAYKLSDVVSVLLGAVESTATHQDGGAWSDFLYAASNAIRGSRKVPVIAPITNVTVGDYDTPAKKALLKLSEVVNLIRGFYNGGWYIDAAGRFVVEAEPFFRNGKSYTAQVVGADLTQYVEPKRGLPWAYGRDNYRYEKQDLPERVEFAWANSVSQPFEGYPIDMLSGFVQKGKVDKFVLARFTSDLDYLLVAPSNVATDGFVFFECVEDGDTLTVPFVEITISAEESYRLQNGYASYLWAHENYWRHNLPCPSVRINGNATTASSVVRSKIQELTIPPVPDFDPYELVTSSLGTGEVVSQKKNLSSGMSEVEVRLDN